MIACLNTNFQIVSNIIAMENINFKYLDKDNLSAVFYAVINPNLNQAIKIVKLLLKKYPQFIIHKKYNTLACFFEAIHRLSPQLVQLFLQNGVNVNQIQQDSGNTPLHEIIIIHRKKPSQSSKAIISLLIKYDSFLSIKNKENKTVIDQYPLFKQQFQHIIQNQISMKTKDKINQTQVNHNQEYQQSQQEQEYQEFMENIDAIKISAQIFQFSIKCQEIYAECWNQILPFYQSLLNIAQQNHLIVEIIGSFATGLWLDSSDIDFVLTPQENCYIIDHPLQKIFTILKKRKQQLNIEQIFLNKLSNFPILKIQMNQKYNNKKIDISTFQNNTHNRKYVQYILQNLQRNIWIKPIFFYLKKISQIFNIHDHKNGGLKSYGLFLMILSIVQNFQVDNIAQLLKNIALYYGFFYQYTYSLNENQQITPNLTIIDPLNHNNNVGGKKTNIPQVQNMFKVLYYSMHRTNLQSLLDYMQKMGIIFK